MLGKIFKYILVILLGMILGAGAVVGAGYLLVTKTKVGTITEKVPSLNEYLGESLNDYTLIEAVQKLSAPDTTIGQYTEYLPFLDGLLKNLAEDESIKQYVTIDIDKLKTFTFSQVGANFMSAVSVTASLNSISDTLGFTLPDLPLFTTKENYVKITDENFAVGNLYYKDKTENIYYIAEEGGYANAYAEGVLVDAAKEKDLYFKSAGLMEIPVTDAVGSLSSTLSDIDSMTIDDLNDDFGIDLIGSDPLVAKIVHGDDTLNSIADNMMSRVDGLTLEGDLGVNLAGSPLEALVGENCTVGELKNMDFDEEIKTLTLADLQIDLGENTLAGKILDKNTTIAQIQDGSYIDGQINKLTVADLGLNITDNGLMSKIISPSDTVEELKNMDYEAAINALAISDLGLKIEEGSLTSKIIPVGTTVGELQNIDFDKKVQELTLGDVIKTDGADTPAILKALSDTKIGELSGKVNTLELKDIVVLPEGQSNPLLDALFAKGATIGNIGEKMNQLTVSDLYEIKGFIDVFDIKDEDKELYKNFRYFTRTGDEQTGYVYTECAAPADLTAVAAGQYYQVDKEAGVWLLLMFEKSGAAGSQVYRESDDVTVVSLADSLQKNVTENIKNCTLQELFEIGFLGNAPSENVKGMTLSQIVEIAEKIPSLS